MHPLTRVLSVKAHETLRQITEVMLWLVVARDSHVWRKQQLFWRLFKLAENQGEFLVAFL